MGIEVKEVNYGDQGHCVRISNHFIDVVVSIDYGPRILRIGFLDDTNLLYYDAEQHNVFANQEWKSYYGPQTAFHVYGGHRVCLAPDRMPQSYYPDNDPVIYGPLNGGVRFTPPRQKGNDVQLSFEVMMGTDASDVMIVNKMRNCSHESKRVSLCGSTLMAPGGVVIIPQNSSGEEKYQPNRNFSLWPFSSFHDDRLSLGDKYILVRQAPSGRDLKFGVNDLQGWAGYSNHGCTLVKRFVHTVGQPYPDFGSSLETCICNDYAELRTLSPLYTVEPGEGIRHVENIALFHSSDLQMGLSEVMVDDYVNHLGI
ncbi:MAG TPA: hypothetical protein DHW78_05570 [Ruminococcaceae bacterium]|jgi:hypothetical protein|nr:hypothetical protein [Oscillospiraceae bacterium]HCA71165.1 hypothetical protein [Oscillospiraceae bacterium]HCC02318.1 hypothetical protein [Oscillospiraceae bacterium]HCM23773.1 hypothetical protein [Oscillospiraceae bacterium]